MNVADELAAGKNLHAEQRGAWLDSLSSDASAIVHTPPGYLHILLLAALTKRALQEKLSVSHRLHFLEKLNCLTDDYLTPYMLSMVEPASDTEFQMIAAARSLDSPDDKAGSASFRVLSTPSVYAHFVALNPSLLAALRWRQQTLRAPQVREN